MRTPIFIASRIHRFFHLGEVAKQFKPTIYFSQDSNALVVHRSYSHPSISLKPAPDNLPAGSGAPRIPMIEEQNSEPMIRIKSLLLLTVVMLATAIAFAQTDNNKPPVTGEDIVPF